VSTQQRDHSIYGVNMSESGAGAVISVNALKVKLLEEQKELTELRLNVEKYQDELKVETEKRAEVSVVLSNLVI